MKIQMSFLAFAFSFGLLALPVVSVASAGAIACTSKGEVVRFVRARFLGRGEASFTVTDGDRYQDSGFLAEEPSVVPGMAFQGTGQMGNGTPTEYFLVFDGPHSLFYWRDLTVMGPTSWRSAALICQTADFFAARQK